MLEYAAEVRAVPRCKLMIEIVPRWKRVLLGYQNPVLWSECPPWKRHVPPNDCPWWRGLLRLGCRCIKGQILLSVRLP